MRPTGLEESPSTKQALLAALGHLPATGFEDHAEAAPVSEAQLTMLSGYLHDLRNRFAVIAPAMDALPDLFRGRSEFDPFFEKFGAIRRAIYEHGVEYANADSVLHGLIPSMAPRDAAGRHKLRAEQFAAGVAEVEQWFQYLSAVIQFLSQAVPAESPESQDDYVVNIRSEIPAALEIAQAAGPELRGVARQPKADNLADIFDTYTVVWKAAAAHHGVRTVDVVPLSSPVPVLVDRVGFLRVMLNLIDNAGRALSEAGRAEAGTIKVAVLPSTKKGVPVEIQILDNGPGFPKETLLAVNSPEPVSQVPSTKPADGKPHGVELASTKATIRDRWHGDIHVESTPGQGSAITILLQTPPRADREEVRLTGASARQSFAEAWGDFHAWLSSQPGELAFQAGDPYGMVPVELRDHDLSRSSQIQVFPDAVWAASRSLPKAFGHLVVRMYQFESGTRTAVLIEDAEFGEGYRALAPARRDPLNGWRSWLIERLVAWATARGHMVLGPERDTELFGDDLWTWTTLQVEHADGAPTTQQRRRVYRGNGAVQTHQAAPQTAPTGLEEFTAVPIERDMEPTLRRRWAVETLGVEA